MIFYYEQFFSNEKVAEYTSLGLTIDGTKGGLLLGQPHSNGGIKFLMRYADGYRLMGEFEGQEYLLNPGATQCYRDNLKQLNQYNKDILLGLSEPTEFDGITIIDCRTNDKLFKSKIVLLDARSSQYIINKYSTRRHLKTLEELNSSIGWSFKGNLISWSRPPTSLLASPNDIKLGLKIENTSILNRFIRFFRSR